jgi:FixJ family two-component response regulator
MTTVAQQSSVIAVIDDNMIFSAAMEAVLTERGYQIELYESANAFLAAAPRSEASCLIIDIQLGDACGVALARQLAENGFTSHVIFVTGSDDPEIKRKALEVGCVAFLRKPFCPDVLTAALSKLQRQGI